MNSDEKVDHSANGNCLPLDLARQESLIDADGCFIYAVDKTFMLMKHDQDSKWQKCFNAATRH